MPPAEADAPKGPGAAGSVRGPLPAAESGEEPAAAAAVEAARGAVSDRGPSKLGWANGPVGVPGAGEPAAEEGASRATVGVGGVVRIGGRVA